MGNPLSEGIEVQDQSTGSNPAWNDLLNEVPQELHPKVTAHLQNWDKGVQERFKQYEPWKDIVSSTDPKQVQWGLQLLGAIEDNPAEVVKALTEFYKLEGTSPNTLPVGLQKSESVDPADPYKARFAQIERGFQLMAQHIMGQREAEANQKADRELQAELDTLKKKFGEFDEPFVLSRMYINGKTGEEAVKEYQEWYSQQVGRKIPKPLFLGSNGGAVPGGTIDPKKRTDAQARDTAMQMLASFQHERDN